MSMIKSADMFDRQAVGLMTDEQIAQRLGISRARVFQLRMRAMAKIKAAILADDYLRDTTEELTGHRLPSVERCATPGCDSHYDVQTVATRQGKRFVGKSLMCRSCRSLSRGTVKVVE